MKKLLMLLLPLLSGMVYGAIQSIAVAESGPVTLTSLPEGANVSGDVQLDLPLLDGEMLQLTLDGEEVLSGTENFKGVWQPKKLGEQTLIYTTGEVALRRTVNVTARWYNPDASITPDVAEAYFFICSLSDGEITITGIQGNCPKEMVIPLSVDGYPVTSIGDYAFRNCSGLTSVTIPSSVTSIGDEAFSGVAPTTLTAAWLPSGMSKDNLKTLIIPEGVTSIKSAAFSGCSSLTSVTIPASVTSIGNNAFNGVAPTTLTAASWLPSGMSKDNLKTLIIPEGVTSISADAFKGNLALTSIVIPSTVKEIGAGAFQDCSALEVVTIAEGLEKIGNDAFKHCGKVAKFTLPTTVRDIGYRVFTGCHEVEVAQGNEHYESVEGILFTKAKTLDGINIDDNVWLLHFPVNRGGVYIVPEHVRTIGDEAFAENEQIEEVTLPAVMVIRPAAFMGCSALKYCFAMDGLLRVQTEAFAEATALTTFTMPASVERLEWAAFRNCSSLAIVAFKGEPPMIDPPSGDYIRDVGTTFVFTGIDYDHQVGATYSSAHAAVWRAELAFGNNGMWDGLRMVPTEDYINNGNDGVFYYTVYDGETTITGTVRALSGEVAIPRSLGGCLVTEIASNALDECGLMDSLTLPVGVKILSNDLFLNCWSLTSFAVAEENVDFSAIDGVLYNNKGTILVSVPQLSESVEIAETVTTIASYAFAYCEYLSEVYLPKSLTTVESAVFEGCDDALRIVFEGSVPTRVAEDAFEPLNAYYMSEYSRIWSRALDKNGMWKNLTMHELAPITLTFKFGYGTDQVVTLYPGDEVEKPSDPARTGYTFTGWTPVIPNKAPNQNTTYTAQWQVNQYTATFKLYDGAQDIVKTQDYGSALTAPDVTRTGYTFTGWSPAVPETVPAQNVTYTAQWKANGSGGDTPSVVLYTITFNANGGTGGKTVKQAAGTPLTAPTVTRTGYTFTGWSPAVPAKTPTQNVTYTAQWKANSSGGDTPSVVLYTITFNANGGTGGKTVKQAAGTPLTAPTVTRTGYTFTGWSPTVPATTPAQNVTYTAQWKANSSGGDTPSVVLYTITFNANGGTGGKTVKQAAGTPLTAPTVTRTGYTFTGWTPAVPATVPAKNVTYTAQWKANATTGDETLTKVDLALLLYTTKKDQATITGCKSSNSGWLDIPSKIGNASVVAIANGAFKGQKNLKKVTLPNTITSIGKDAFAGCSNLDVNAIVMPNQAKLKVGKGAFTSCKVTEVSAVPGEPLTSKQLGKAAGYKAATTASGLKVNAKTGDITATFKKSGTYEAVLFKPGATLKAIRIKVGDMPKLTIKMEGANTGCSVKGEGSYLMGKKVSLSAKASKEKIFIGFYDEKGNELTKNMKYSFVMGRENRTLTAKFKEEIITINTSALTSKTWKVGETVNVTIPVTAESGVKSVKAKLPTGLKLAKTKDNTWQVTGSPKKMGAYTVTFTVGTVQKKQKIVTFTMNVVAESVTINTSAVKNKTLNVGQAASGLTIGATATSGIKSVKASKLPSGMKVQQIDGVWQLTGAPKKAGTYTVTLTITTKANTKVTETFTLTVALIPEWAVKTFSGEVINVWEEDDGEYEMYGYAQITVLATGEVKGRVSLDDDAFATLSGTAKLLESSTNKVRLQLVVPWFDSYGKADGKVKTDLVIQKTGQGVTLTYLDVAKDSSVTGTLR